MEPVRGGGVVGGAVGPNGKWSSSSLDSSSGAWRSAEGGLFVLVLVPVRSGGEVGGASSLDSISGACRSIGERAEKRRTTEETSAVRPAEGSS